MQKLSIVFLLVLALASFSQETTEKITRANIAVILPEIIGTDSRLAVLSLTIRDNIAFTLKLMGRYKVTTQDQPVDFEDRDAIKSHAKKNKLDSIIFGRIIKMEDDSIMIKMAIYDQYSDKITMEEEVSIKSIFEIFDASDMLVVKLLEGFSGMHVAYGSLNLKNKGDKGRYKVFIDSEYIGDTLSSIPKVFYGEHTIRVEQDRLFGEKIVLLDEVINLKEDETLNLTFNVPQLTERESREFHKIDLAIMENWDKYNEIVADSIKEVLNILVNTSSSSRLEELKDKYIRLNETYSQIPGYIEIENNIKIENIQKYIWPESKTYRGEFQNFGSAGVLSKLSITNYQNFNFDIIDKLATEYFTTTPDIINSFTKPIYSYITDKKPDFEDDFSTDSGYWDQGWHGGDLKDTSIREAKDGKLYYYGGSSYEKTKHLGSSKFIYTNYILQMDFAFQNFNTDLGIEWNLSNSNSNIVNGLILHLYVDGKWSVSKQRNGNSIRLSSGICTILPLKKESRLIFISLGHSFSIFIDEFPIFYGYVADIRPSAIFHFSMTTRAPGARKLLGTFDNIKLWDLDPLISE